MVELVVLLMPHCSRECLIMQDYDLIEAKYFERNPRIQWSERHVWWYNRKGKRIDPDRWRLWSMWEENRCGAYVVQLRNTLWAQTILRKMLCPPGPFDLDMPESSDQSPGFRRKVTPKNAKTQAHCHAQVAVQEKTQGRSQSGTVVIALNRCCRAQCPMPGACQGR